VTSRTQWLLVAGIVVIGTVGLLYATNVIGGGIPAVEAGTVAPPFTLPEPATGARVSLDEFAGPALVITFIYLVPNDRQPRGS